MTELDWFIVRPAALTNQPGRGMVDLGPAKVHVDIAWEGVAGTVFRVLHEPCVNHVILEVTNGTTPVTEAVAAMRR